VFLLSSSVHGNKAGNENPGVLALQVLWFRNHNYHADRLAALYRSNTSTPAEHEATYWNDERLFLEARKWNIAEYQSIAVNEWLPAFVGRGLPPYAGYVSTINPGVAEVFQLAAMRFGHSLVPSALLRRDLSRTCAFRTTSERFGVAGRPALRTCNTYSRGNEILAGEGDGEDSMGEWLLGLASQYTDREDMLMTDDLRQFVFGPVNYNRRDLAAINIQRGRDHGVADYNTVRASYGLPRRDSFTAITTDPEQARKMAALYGNDTKLIDLFVGGMAETIDGPGELFTAIILDQFARVRDGDRFWYANEQNGMFSADDIAKISSTALADLVKRHTSVSDDQLGQSMFFLRPEDPCQPPEDLGSLSLENCTALAMHDYWDDADPSALPGTAMLFVGFFICCLLGVWLTLTCERRKRRKLMQQIDDSFSAPLRPFDAMVTPPPTTLAEDVHLKLQLADRLPCFSPPHGGGQRFRVHVPLPPVDEREQTAASSSMSSATPESAHPIHGRLPAQVSVSSSPLPPSEPMTSIYGAVLYAPSMGTAAVYAEIQERSVDPSAPLVTTTAGARIDPGSSVGWLSVRSAAESGESLYHVPLSFVHSVVIFGARTRVRDGGGAAGGSSDGAQHHALSSPVSVTGAFSCSAMTRCERELRINPVDDYPHNYNASGHTPVPTYGTPQAMATAPRSPSVRSGKGDFGSTESDSLEPLRNRSILLKVPKRYDVSVERLARNRTWA
jgi:hypothetical protein